jgi:hypothetical protein
MNFVFLTGSHSQKVLKVIRLETEKLKDQARGYYTNTEWVAVDEEVWKGYREPQDLEAGDEEKK